MTRLVLTVLLLAACTSVPPPKGGALASTSAAPTSAGTVAGFAAAPPGKRLAVLWTSSVQGYVEPCGCTGDPLGGVARVAAAVDEAKRAYGGRVLFLDGGDLLFEHETDSAPADACQAGARDDLLVDTWAKLGLAATALGPLDDVRGPAWRDARLAKAGVPTLSVNPPRALVDGATLAPALVRDVGPARVAVLAFNVAPGASASAAGDEARAHDALAAAVARQTAAKADVVVVLAQASRAAAKRVVAGIPGIDVVIAGHAPGEVPIPPEALPDGAVLVAAGMQAQYLGVLELNLEGRAPGARLALDDDAAQAAARKKELDLRIHVLEKQIADLDDGPRKQFFAAHLAEARREVAGLGERARGDQPLAPASMRVRAVPLPRGFAEDPGAARALAAYEKSIPALVASCEANVTCPAPKEGQPTYVGAATCAGCHAAAYAFWQQQSVTLPAKDEAGRPFLRVEGHAHAWTTLTDVHKDKDRDCVSCHSVGFSLPGGPCKTGDVVARGLSAVQCESCHGPGSVHAVTRSPDDIRGKPDEATCRSCHHVPHIPTTESFVFTDRLKLILGKGHGERRLREIEATP